MSLALVAYTPFIDPLPIWSPNWLWAVLLIPLCAAVALVYKTIKCHAVSQVPREALILLASILLGMFMAAAALAAVVKFME